MSDLRHEYAPSWSGWPPRMARNDYAIWQKHRPKLGKDAIKVWYDVGLGPGRNPGETTDPAMLEMWKRNTQWRADVIVEYPGHYEIIELRENATADALGRIILYQMLWDKEKPLQKPSTTTIVTNLAAQNLRELAAARGVGLIEEGD